MKTEPVCRKGIILAGGAGTRLLSRHPCRQQANVAGLRQADDLLSAVDADAGRHPGHAAHLDPDDIGSFQRLLGDGSNLGISIRYAVQPRPEASPRRS